jgi:hypothetical protein
MKGSSSPFATGFGIACVFVAVDTPLGERYRMFRTNFHRFQHSVGWWSGKPVSQETVVLTDPYVDGHPTRLTLSGIMCKDCGFLQSTTSKYDPRGLSASRRDNDPKRSAHLDNRGSSYREPFL